jgi:hypothetical protein
MQCKDCLYFKRCVALGVELDMKHDKDAEKNCRHFTAKTGEWIDVKDRLPEDNERVLTFSESLSQSSLGGISVQFGWCCKRRNMDISYWMPLPEPPEAKKEGAER